MLNECLIAADIEFLISELNTKFKPELNLNFRFKLIETDSIKPSTRFLNIDRYKFAQQLSKSYQNIPKFYPVWLPLNKDEYKLVAPPVVEERAEGNIVCDGMHRVYNCRMSGIEKIWVLCVDNSPLPLAGDLLEWKDVKIIEYQSNLHNNFINFNPRGYTGYSKFFNSQIMIKSKSEVLNYGKH